MNFHRKLLPLGVLALACLAVSVSAQTLDLWPATSVATAAVRKADIQALLRAVNQPLGTTLCNQKMQAMNASAFYFVRGANQLFYRDMANRSVISRSAFGVANATTWLQGDMHLQNAGAFDNDQGTVIYDLNDFDESFVGNYYFDVLRFAMSVVLVGRELAFTDATVKPIVSGEFARFYLDEIKAFQNGSAANSKVWTSTNAYGVLDNFIADAETTNTRRAMLDKYSYKFNGQRFFLSNADMPDVDAVNATERSAITAAMTAYYTQTITSGLKGNAAYFAVQDIARRLNAGTGSLGTPRYYVIVEGDTTDADDDRILDVKLQSKPTIWYYLNSTQRAAVDSKVVNDADRVIQAQKNLLSRADNHLGYMIISGSSFSVRERSPYKESLDTAGLTSGQFSNLAQQWGSMLARAHARADRNATFVPLRFESTVYAVAGSTATKITNFGNEVATFAINYANQVATDFTLFRQLLSENAICA